MEAAAAKKRESRIASRAARVVLACDGAAAGAGISLVPGGGDDIGSILLPDLRSTGEDRCPI
jgi:hypothetical protein